MKRSILLLMFVIVLVACVAVYWNFILPETVIPVAPVPDGAVLLTHSSHSATQGFWYIDEYAIESDLPRVEEFYKHVSSDCFVNEQSRPDIVVEDYLLSCIGRAKPIGDFYVEIGREDMSQDSKLLIVVEVRW